MLCGCVWVFILHPLLFPSGGGRKWALSSEYKIDQVNFTDWMSFLTSNKKWKATLIQKLSPQIPKAFLQHGGAEKAKIDLSINALLSLQIIA